MKEKICVDIRGMDPKQAEALRERVKRLNRRFPPGGIMDASRWIEDVEKIVESSRIQPVSQERRK